MEERNASNVAESMISRLEMNAIVFLFSRSDGLSRRIVRGDDMELTEEYVGRESDGMVGMHVIFGMAKKEFGPADGKGGAKEVCKITEKFAENPAVLDNDGDSEDDLGDPDDLVIELGADSCLLP